MDECITQSRKILQNQTEKSRTLKRKNQKYFKKQKLCNGQKDIRSNKDQFSKSLAIEKCNTFKTKLNSSNLITFEGQELPDYLNNIKQFLEYHSSLCCESITLESIDILLNKDLENGKERENYNFNKHSDISPDFRLPVLDWIQEICSTYKFQRETYYLTMAYFDIYVSKCSINSIKKEQLQLIAVSSLMMAAKVEEVKSLPMEDMSFLCDKLFSVEQLINTEKSIIEVLEWKCYPSTPNLWFLRFIHILNKTITAEEYYLCTRLLDVATSDLNYLKYPSNILAAACIKLVISIHIFPKSSDPRFSLKIKECALWLRKYWQKIYSSYKQMQRKSFTNYELENEKCPRFSHLSFIQSYFSNTDILKKM